MNIYSVFMLLAPAKNRIDFNWWHKHEIVQTEFCIGMIVAEEFESARKHASLEYYHD